jgi:DNA-binding response OmpR family regulator
MSAPPTAVLVIEDESDVREALVSYLLLEGMHATGVSCLSEAESWLQSQPVDVLLLDLALPDGNGLSWLAKRDDLRDKGVIITSARSDALSRVSGVRAGADVYLVKPVLPEEVVSLIENLMRRLRGDASKEGWVLEAKGWRLLTPAGQALKLTHSEHALLLRLAQGAGQVVEKDDLAIALGHAPHAYDFRRLEVLVRRLRSKASESLGSALPLETAHRRGYSFTARIKVLLD